MPMPTLLTQKPKSKLPSFIDVNEPQVPNNKQKCEDIITHLLTNDKEIPSNMTNKKDEAPSDARKITESINDVEKIDEFPKLEQLSAKHKEKIVSTQKPIETQREQEKASLTLQTETTMFQNVDK